MRKSLFIATAVFIVVSIIGYYWTSLNRSLTETEHHHFLTEIASGQADAISRRLNRSLGATQVLGMEVRRHQGDLDEFEQYAADLIAMQGGISNLQLAPAGIVRKIYPLAGNEKAIGHNILRDDKRKGEAQRAVREKRLTLAGPFELIQGGIAVIGRNPVFLSNKYGVEQFWGFASALIYLEDLLKVTELRELEQRGYSYELLFLNPDTNQTEVFARSVAAHAESDIVSVSIPIPNGSWFLRLSLPYGVSFTSAMVQGMSISLVLALLLAFFTYRMLNEPARLRVLVKDQTEELENIAFHDGLTGLANRNLMQTQIEQVLKQIKRQQIGGALLYLDLDDFKRVNDAFGHEVGDQLLCEVADRLRHFPRASDLISRFGGDEFAILLQEISSGEQASILAEKLQYNLQQPYHVQGRELVIHASMGIVLLPQDGSDLETVMRHADLALYASKRAGKGHFTFFDPQMQMQAMRNMLLEQQLRKAIPANELRLHYQPVIDLENDQPCGFEALVRWQHPTEGLLPPAVFIGLAEQTGIIVELGYWVLEESARFLQRRQQAGLDVLPVAVNVSPRQLQAKDFVTRVQEIISSSGVSPELFELEITESVLIENFDEAEQLILKLKAFGLSFSIDDFGTGYSSFSQLKQLPFNKLKIDRSFVSDLSEGSNDVQIVAAIIAVARELGMDVIAEGVEETEQRDILLQLSCHHVQGFLFSKPQPEESWLTKAQVVSEVG